MRKILAIFVLFLSSVAQAENDPYAFCSIAGFLQQDSSTFTSSIALTAASEKGIFMNPICDAAYKNGQEAHRKFSGGQRLSENDQIVFNQALDFKEKVNKHILRSIGY